MALDGKAGNGLSGTYIPLRAAFAGRRSRGTGLRALLFFTECALGIVSVLLVGAFAHWLQWLLPVAVLLYLLIIVPTALWCGFWQAVIVSLSAVVEQSYFSSRQGRLNPEADATNSITLVAFILTSNTPCYVVCFVRLRLVVRINATSVMELVRPPLDSIYLDAWKSSPTNNC